MVASKYQSDTFIHSENIYEVHSMFQAVTYVFRRPINEQKSLLTQSLHSSVAAVGTMGCYQTTEKSNRYNKQVKYRGY